MAAIVVVAANKLLDASLGTTALTAFSGAAKLRLTTTAPTNARSPRPARRRCQRSAG